jgi:GntR family transcriptional regulator / MocR family aminotransferase
MAEVSAGVFPVVSVDRESKIPLHRQIYEGYRTAILRGDLRPGQQLPSSRALATEIGVSRFPILDAYAQLLTEGYFESRTGAGTFVSESLPDQLTSVVNRNSSGNHRAAHIDSKPRPVSRRAALLPEFPDTPWRYGWGAFGVHQPALDQFPFRIWSGLVARHSLSPRAAAIHHIDPLGLEPFREVISNYLRTARGVRCDPQQIMIVSGSQQALEIASRVLLDSGDTVWIEEPGYQLTRAVLMGSGCRLVPLPVDREGMDVAAGIKRSGKARAAFVTPSHQYPLGVTMSASRRLQLLNWAHSSGGWIIEDDYDSEYRYGSMPIASLQGLDRNSRVIYIGTFSKVLFASLRIGYMVIPADLVERFRTVRFAMDIFPPFLYQEVLTDFITEGHFARHIRRMRLLYSERRTTLAQSIREEFGNEIEIHGAEAGMHMTVTLPEGLQDVKIAERAARDRVWLWPLSPSYVGKKKRQGFVLGFGSAPTEQIPQAVRHMRAAFLR